MPAKRPAIVKSKDFVIEEAADGEFLDWRVCV